MLKRRNVITGWNHALWWQLVPTPRPFCTFAVLRAPPSQAACCKAGFFSAFESQLKFHFLRETFLITCRGWSLPALSATSPGFVPCWDASLSQVLVSIIGFLGCEHLPLPPDHYPQVLHSTLGHWTTTRLTFLESQNLDDYTWVHIRTWFLISCSVLHSSCPQMGQPALGPWKWGVSPWRAAVGGREALPLVQQLPSCFLCVTPAPQQGRARRREGRWQTWCHPQGREHCLSTDTSQARLPWLLQSPPLEPLLWARCLCNSTNSCQVVGLQIQECRSYPEKHVDGHVPPQMGFQEAGTQRDGLCRGLGGCRIKDPWSRSLHQSGGFSSSRPSPAGACLVDVSEHAWMPGCLLHVYCTNIRSENLAWAGAEVHHHPKGSKFMVWRV